MRLINTKNLKLEFFTPSRIPPYVILSHTWSEDSNEEVSFQDFDDLDKAKTKPGFSKIEMTCKLARDSKIEYAWVDTCCIDKSSSAELSESLNSMYSWYQKSYICYAHINDWQRDFDWVDLTPLEQEDGSIHQGDDSGDTEEDSDGGDGGSSDEGYSDVEHVEHGENSFINTIWQTDEQFIKIMDNSMDQELPSDTAASGETYPQSGLPSIDEPHREAPLRWFTRGWTLQELIAPCKMEFYDANWTLRGTKQDSVVVEHISRITGIPTNVLTKNSERALQEICLGQRMSWAAYRKTSREEDIAYCLLGIFQVNMPMLYGEGDNAFLRLQEEILKHSTNLSLFAWTQHYQERPKQNYRGILSRNPREFYRLKNCSLLNTQFKNTEELVMINKGLRFNTSLFRPAYGGLTPDFVDINFMDLSCLIDGKPQGIFLQRMFDFYVVDAWPDGFFDRIKSTFLASTPDKFTGFVKIAITEKTPPVDERRRIADVILVVVFNLEKFLAYVLDEEHVSKFETFAKSTSNMDHTTATTELEKYGHATSKYSKSEITVTDSLTNMSFRVSVRPRTKKLHADSLHIVFKAVKVELSL